MKITQRATWSSIDDFIAGKPPVEWKGFEYSGPLALAGGGSKVTQTNKQQAGAAFGSASGAASQSQALGKDLSAEGKADRAAVRTATAGFMDPATLNVDRPTGVFRRQYEHARGIIAKQGQAARGGVARSMANRGFGEGSGMEVGNLRGVARDTASTMGDAWSEFAGKSYDDAAQKFWSAVGLRSGTGTDLAGIGANSVASAGQTYANLYGTAGQGHVTQNSNLGGALIGAGGSIAGGALACPVGDARVVVAEGSDDAIRLVRDLDFQSAMRCYDRSAAVIKELPPSVIRECVEVETQNHYKAEVSVEHTWKTAGGYVYAGDCLGSIVETLSGPSEIVTVKPTGKKPVFPLVIGGQHSYNVDGIWSLS
jgi:hypothetical protein